jgi:CheY-like chemotaxis protein
MIDPQAIPSRAKILIVDNKVTNLSLLTAVLYKEGYEVRAAINGTMAIKAAQAVPPDLILLDINMPVLNGYDVCKSLKADARTQDIPIIFVSALDTPQDRSAAFEAGGVDYLVKPLQVPEILARVGMQLKLQQQRMELKRYRARSAEHRLAVQRLQTLGQHGAPPGIWKGPTASAPKSQKPPAREVRALLAADIAELTRLVADLDPAPLLEDLSTYMSSVLHSIIAHHGDIHECSADQILASFRDPQGAIQAAREILRRGALFNAARATSGRPRFSPRLGIATGKVVLASLGWGTSREATIIGERVRWVRRLCHSASPGTLLMDEATHAAAGFPGGASLVEIPLRQERQPTKAYTIRTEAILTVA